MKQAIVRRSAGVAAISAVFLVCLASWLVATPPAISFAQAAQAPVASNSTATAQPIVQAAPAAQTPQAQSPGAAEKTAAEQFKNVQVLKDMPASQMQATMNFVRASLGVRCDFCHVTGPNQEFDKDDKPAKLTARKMMQMQFAINKASFNGRAEVTCYTCHRGSSNPVGIPSLEQQAAPRQEAGGPAGAGQQGRRGEGPPAAQARPQMPPAADLFEKYAAAIGGKEAVDKLKSRVMKGTQILGNGTSIPVEIDIEAPNKILITITTPRGVTMQGFDGANGWVKDFRGQRVMSAFDAGPIKRLADFSRDVNLKDLYPRARVVAKEKIGDRDAYTVIARDAAGGRIRLSFDVESGLLLRQVTYIDTVLGSLPEQSDFEEYKDVDGVKVAMTIRTTQPEGGSTRKYTEVKHNVAFEAGKFAAPETK